MFEGTTVAFTWSE